MQTLHFVTLLQHVRPLHVVHYHQTVQLILRPQLVQSLQLIQLLQIICPPPVVLPFESSNSCNNGSSAVKSDMQR
jgi:hypothetical protein